jgi:hypothetical protein
MPDLPAARQVSDFGFVDNVIHWFNPGFPVIPRFKLFSYKITADITALRNTHCYQWGSTA